VNVRKPTVSVLLSLLLVFSAIMPSFAANATLREKMTDPSVQVLQSNLLVLGYFPAKTKTTRYFGTVTKAAVMKYQKAFKLKEDGIVSPALLKQIVDKAKKKTAAAVVTVKKETSAAIASTPVTPSKAAISMTSVVSSPAIGTTEAGIGIVLDLLDVSGAAVSLSPAAAALENIPATVSGTDAATTLPAEDGSVSRGGERNFLAHWFEEVRYVFKTGMDATIYDIGTGRTFLLNYSMTSANHADCETKTAADTETMLTLWGGAFSSKSRPVIIFVEGNAYAGSVAGRPHCGRDALPFLAKLTEGDAYGDYVGRENCDKIKGNNMDGHLDVHFYKSRNHYNNLEDPYHQKNVLLANDWAKANMPAGTLPAPVTP